jgi:putative copper resistance protein D
MMVARTVHFAASAITAGALMFRGFVAERQPRLSTSATIWIALAVTVVSGLALVLLLTMSLNDERLGEAMTSGALREVLNLTQFGLVTQVCLAIAVVLAIYLAFERSALWRWLALAAALSLAASIAWTGHAASTPFA